MICYQVLSWLAVFSILLTGLGASEPLGKLDLRDVKAYVARLEHSNTAEARAVRFQVEDGPDHVAYQRRAARRAGIPLNPRELQAVLPPSGENAALEYVKVRNALESRPLDSNSLAIFQKMDKRIPLSDEDIAPLRNVLKERADVIDLLHHAGDKSLCVFKRDWEHGLSLLFWENYAIRDSARLLRAESFLLAKDGPYSEAIDNAARIFRMAEHAASDPTQMCLDLGLNTEDIAVTAMELTLYAVGANAEVAERIQQAIAAHSPRYNLRRMIEGELVLMTLNMNKLRTASPEFLATLQGGEGLDPALKAPKNYSTQERKFVNKLVDAAEASMLGNLRDLITRADTTDDHRMFNFRWVDQCSMLKEEYPASIFVGEPFTSAATSAVTIALGTARRAVVMAGAALLAYRARNGSFPDRLEDVIKEPPIDPFSGNAVKYRRETAGFVVYSVGIDGKFDGGTPDMKPKLREAYFRYPQATPRTEGPTE